MKSTPETQVRENSDNEIFGRPRMYRIRGREVYLDCDVAKNYGIATRNLNRAARRHASSIPSEDCFTLTRKELAELKCQIGTVPKIVNDRAIGQEQCQIGTSVVYAPLPEDGPEDSLKSIFSRKQAIQREFANQSRKENNRELYGWSMNYGGARKPPTVYTETGALIIAKFIKTALADEALLNAVYWPRSD